MLVAVAPAQDVPAPARYAAVRNSIVKGIASGAAPAVSVAVLERGELVWAEGFGLADIARETKATADTIYRLASISKPFTATALMRLVDGGAVDLDKPVNTYLEKPGVRAYRGKAEDITARRLANHTSGLPTHWSFFYGDDRPPPRAETIRRYGFAAWVPGTRTNYSNLAFGILDHVIARTSKKSYRDYLVTEVLDPLGLRHTDVGVRPDKAASAAVAYRREKDAFEAVTEYGFDHDGASAVRSSARDLMQFARLHIGAGAVGDVRVLSRDAALEMQRIRGEAGSRYGVAWSVTATRGALTLRHTGGMPGVATSLQVFPGQGSAVAVLCNCKNRQIVNTAMREAVSVALREVQPEDLSKMGGPGPGAPSPWRHPSSPAGHYRGEVLHHDGPIALEVKIEGDRVELRLGNTDVRELLQQKVTVDRLRLRFSAPLPTTASLKGTPGLELGVDRSSTRDADGWSGLLYAVGPGTLRLPHWVRLERVE